MNDDVASRVRVEGLGSKETMGVGDDADDCAPHLAVRRIDPSAAAAPHSSEYRSGGRRGSTAGGRRPCDAATTGRRENLPIGWSVEPDRWRITKDSPSAYEKCSRREGVLPS